VFYIMTLRGWRLLHKRHYEIAGWWREKGWDVEEHVHTLRPFDHWVSENNFSSWDVTTRLLYSAKQRARKLSIKFDITYKDFEIPEVCPLRGVALNVGFGKHSDDSPTLDRKDPRLGYVKGNVWVISHKANRLKGNFTPEELRTFCENVLALDWVTWTSVDEDAFQEALRWQQAEVKRKMNEKHRPRWCALFGSGPKSEGK
jgi:hypothetical protein